MLFFFLQSFFLSLGLCLSLLFSDSWSSSYLNFFCFFILIFFNLNSLKWFFWLTRCRSLLTRSLLRVLPPCLVLCALNHFNLFLVSSFILFVWILQSPLSNLDPLLSLLFFIFTIFINSHSHKLLLFFSRYWARNRCFYLIRNLGNGWGCWDFFRLAVIQLWCHWLRNLRRFLWLLSWLRTWV